MGENVQVLRKVDLKISPWWGAICQRKAQVKKKECHSFEVRGFTPIGGKKG